MRKDDNGRITLAWTDFGDDRFVVAASSLDSRCGTARQTIGVPGADAVLGDLTVGPSGRATIALTAGIRGSDGPPDGVSEAAHGILAAQRPSAGTGFAAPVQVSAADDNELEPAVAIDQTNGRSVVAWRGLGPIEFATAP